MIPLDLDLLSNPDLPWRVRVVPETCSTSDDVRAAALAGEEPGLVIFAEAQTAGRGRRENRWIAPRGKDLMFTLLLRPQAPIALWPRMTTLAALAISLATGTSANEMLVVGSAASVAAFKVSFRISCGPAVNVLPGSSAITTPILPCAACVSLTTRIAAESMAFPRATDTDVSNVGSNARLNCNAFSSPLDSNSTVATVIPFDVD